MQGAKGEGTEPTLGTTPATPTGTARGRAGMTTGRGATPALLSPHHSKSEPSVDCTRLTSDTTLHKPYTHTLPLLLPVIPPSPLPPYRRDKGLSNSQQGSHYGGASYGTYVHATER